MKMKIGKLWIGPERVYVEDGGYMYAPVLVGQLVEEYRWFDGNTGASGRRFAFANEMHDRPRGSWNNYSTQTIDWWRVEGVPQTHLMVEDVIANPDEENELRESPQYMWESGGHVYLKNQPAMYASAKIVLEKINE